jgi:hypothetical protein
MVLGANKEQLMKRQLSLRVLGLSLALLGAIPCWGEDSAQPASQAPTTARPARRSGPPVMPASFDRETVQRLVDHIEQGHNASILHVGYFMRRKQHALPQSKGMKLLNEAISKETAGSKRWFVMQTLRGFAAFRATGVASDEGLEAYTAIFDQAAKAKPAKAEYQLRQAINEYVFGMQGRIRDLGLRYDERAQDLLLKAWSAYVTHVLPGQTAKGQSASRVRQPMWAAAIQDADLEEKFLPLLDKFLKSPTTPKSYSLLKEASMLYAPSNPKRSLALLLQARPLVPTSNKLEAGRFFDLLAKALEKEDRLPDAVQAREERVKLTGKGQPQLARLYYQAKNDKALDATLQALKLPSASSRDVVDTIDELSKVYSQDRIANLSAGVRAADLASNYLKMQQVRDVEHELSARIALGDFLIGQKNLAGARAALKIDHLKPRLTTNATKSYVQYIQLLLKKLNDTKKVKVENK